MKFKTVKAVRLELQRRGGFLETIRDTELPEYVPHLSATEQGWIHGVWIKAELLKWASENLTHA
jgi:transposase